MRPIDWRRLLTEQRVPFIETGPNVKRGEVSIQCPFCGSADPSKHLGLNLETGWWSCWRNRSQHSGKSPVRLIMQLLKVSYGAARELAGLDATYVDPEGFDALAARLMGRSHPAVTVPQTEAKELHLPGSLISQQGTARHCYSYLEQRGFSDSDVLALAQKYGLRAGTGLWGGRILIPYLQNGELVTWTGRAIAPSRARYKDLDLESSLCAPKETLYNHDVILEGGRALVIQEGPFDVLKIDFYGHPYRVRSVGLSTNSISTKQAILLHQARSRFEQIIVMLDTKSRLGIVDSMRLKQNLSFLGAVSILPVPFAAGDGGNLRPEQVREFCQSI